VGLEEEVRQLVSVGAWRQLFMITDTSYEQLALEVLSTFEMFRGVIAFHQNDFIQFQAFGAMHKMSLTEFSIHLGLYNADFTRTPEYDALLTSRPPGESMVAAWRRIGKTKEYDPRQTKATSLVSPAVRYMHYMLSHTITGRGDSTGVVSLRELDMLMSMVDGFHLHLGFEVAYYIHRQGTNPRIGAIFVGPYITRIIRSMGLLPCDIISGLRAIGGVLPVTIETLRSMGMLRRIQTAQGIMYQVRRDPDLASTSAPTAAAPSRPSSSHRGASTSRPEKVYCSLSSFLWMQWSIQRIASHMGVTLSPPPSSPDDSPPRQATDPAGPFVPPPASSAPPTDPPAPAPAVSGSDLGSESESGDDREGDAGPASGEEDDASGDGDDSGDDSDTP